MPSLMPGNMEPDAALRAARDALREMADASDDETRCRWMTVAVRHYQDLDNLASGGGPLPREWRW